MPNIQEIENRAARLLYGNLFLEDLTVTDDMAAGGDVTVAGNMTSVTAKIATLDTPSTTIQRKAIASVAVATLVSANDNGKIFVDIQGALTTVFTLPTPTAGMNFTFINGDAGGEIRIVPDALSSILVKIHAAQDGTLLTLAAGAGIKNTAATNVAGDAITIIALNTTTWYVTDQIGLWAAT